ncbi:VOC family protein [Amycolatopsis sp. NPDC059021]|uniref:VOC family protein n=1 Tax=Amycolatopsis sp. NPDC059021 TaxID=3346704 RepID=UPI00366A6C33
MSSDQTDGYLGLAPYLYYADATTALAWLTRVFGFTEELRFTDSTGEVFQATLNAGGCRIQLAGVGDEYWTAKGVDGPVGQLNILYVDDVDAQYERIKGILGDEVEIDPPQDQPYGARVFTVADIGGNSWTFWQQVSDTVELPPGWSEVRADPDQTGRASNG